MTATVTLYERTEALRLVDEWIAEHEEEILAAGGDLDALPELRALLDQAEGDFKDKVERVALKVRELTATADAVKAEADRLKNRVNALDNAAASLKEYLKRNMEAVGVQKVNGLLATVAVQSVAAECEMLAHARPARAAQGHRVG
jgi:chromosome segregation ATPase